MRGAIILGGHVQALGIVRILGQRSIPVIVVDSSRYSLARRSKFCTAFFLVSDEGKLQQMVELQDMRSSSWARGAALTTRAG